MSAAWAGTARALLAAALALAAAVAHAAAPEIVVEAAREGDAYVITARGDVVADDAVAWQVLTDYDRYAAFIPDLHASRTVSRSRDAAVVEQRGELRFLFIRFPLQVKYAVREQPPTVVESRATSGSFRAMTGRYELRRNGAALRIAYTGRLVPDFAMPPLLGTIAVRMTVERQFTAMVEEIARQSAAAVR